MAKATKMMATKNNMIAKRAALDADIKAFIDINEQRKALEKKEKALRAKIEAQYVDDASVKEILKGNEMYAQKIPSKRNVTWDYDALDAMLTAADTDLTVDNIAAKRVVIDVNTKALQELVKAGVVPQALVDKCFTCDYTFSSKFGEIKDLDA